jgi:DNA repair protein RadC
MGPSGNSVQIHAGHRERLWTRFLENGLDGFADHQVLELLLFHAVPRGDTNPIAHRLMQRFGNLSAVLEADPKDLARVEGVGAKVAAFLALIPQITRRYHQDRVNREAPRLANSEAVAE